MVANVSTTLVVGAGGTGRTFRLRELADENAVWLSGSPHRSTTVDQLEKALGNDATQLIVDDVQWFDDAAVEAAADAVAARSVIVSRRPWPTTPAIRALDDALSSKGEIERLGLMEMDEFGAAVSELLGGPTSSDTVELLHAATGGSVGLAADSAAGGWDGALDEIPDTVIDAVNARAERSGDQAMELLAMLALAPDLDPVLVIRSVEGVLDVDTAERSARAGGLLDAEGRPHPLVVLAARRGLTAGERAGINDKLAVALLARAPESAMRHLIEGSGKLDDGPSLLAEAAERVAVLNPELCLELIELASEQGMETAALTLVQASAAFRAGRHDALGFQSLPADAARLEREALALIGYGTDIRDLRWQSATGRVLTDDIQAPMHTFAQACLGSFVKVDVEPSATDQPEMSVISRLSAGLFSVVDGNPAAGLGLLATAADDYDRQQWSLPLGITPHVLGATCSIWVGDVAAAQGLLDQAVDQQSGGPGEATTHYLLRAYARLLNGDYADALDAVRAGDETTWPLRDRLLVAAIDAAIARRSGDTARLRDAWARSEAVLLRPTGTWLFLDPVLELLTAGARLGDARRVRPVAEGLVDQLVTLPTNGVGPASARWLELQLALSRRENSDVRLAASALQTIVADAVGAGRELDHRILARAAAAGVWATLTDGRADEEGAIAASELLVQVGDAWEASRILGQTALDHKDPKAARRLLEAARSASVDLSDAESGDGLLALGLSERESEVALLVSDGKTYKEIGAQLYISPKTVEHHVANIRQKLGAQSRAEMVSIVRRASQGS